MRRRGSLAAPLAHLQHHREVIITTAIQISKATRGTKRVCLSCETRFYDLAREHIVCPSCGVEYKPVAAPVFTLGARAPSAKTGWRSKTQRHPKPELPVDPEEAVPEIAAEAADEAPTVDADDDLVLEQEPDDSNVADLIEHDGEEPKDR